MIIIDLYTVILNYPNNNNLLKLRLVNKKLKTLVYKFGRLNVNSYDKERCFQVINICNKTKLHLTHENKLDDCDVINLKKNIISLNLSYNNKITDKSIKYLKNLTSLDLDWNNTITDASIKDLKNLTSLDLSHNNKITDAGIKDLKNLTDLKLRFNNSITDLGIKDLKKLTRLNIFCNFKITDIYIKNSTNIRFLGQDTSYLSYKN